MHKKLSKTDINRLMRLKTKRSKATLSRTGIFETLYQDMNIGRATGSKIELNSRDIKKIRELFLQQSGFDIFSDVDFSSRESTTEHFSDEKLNGKQVKANHISVYPLNGESITVEGKLYTSPEGGYITFNKECISSIQHSQCILVENFETFLNLKNANFNFSTLKKDALIVYRGDKETGITMSLLKKNFSGHVIAFFDCDFAGFAMAKASLADELIVPNTNVNTFKKIGSRDLYDIQSNKFKLNPRSFPAIYTTMMTAGYCLTQEALIFHQVPLTLEQNSRS